ncbi:hypothetical protein BC827DRAFT_585339 [Russula dissimulans]|nr:hypothetical protein BC827DRAFT_585339 [Russula dissimulans]
MVDRFCCHFCNATPLVVPCVRILALVKAKVIFVQPIQYAKLPPPVATSHHIPYDGVYIGGTDFAKGFLDYVPWVEHVTGRTFHGPSSVCTSRGPCIWPISNNVAQYCRFQLLSLCPQRDSHAMSTVESHTITEAGRVRYDMPKSNLKTAMESPSSTVSPLVTVNL